MQKENPRSDCVSHKRYPKEALLRLVAAEGAIHYDSTGKADGRGLYVLKDEETIKKLSAKHLRKLGNVTNEQLAALKEELLSAIR